MTVAVAEILKRRRWWWGCVPAVEASETGLRWRELLLLFLLLVVVLVWWKGHRPVGLKRRLWRWRLVELMWDRRHKIVDGTPVAWHEAIIRGRDCGGWW